MLSKKSILSLWLFVAPLLIFAQQPVDQIINTLRNKNSDQVLVVAHRADWRNFPENSIEGINSAITMGVDMVEIDIAKTKDGKLVLMHDKTIDRTTTGKGKVSEWTLDSLRQLYLRNGHAQPSRFRVPTLEEAMIACKGKVLVNLDKGYDHFAEIYDILLATNTLNQTVIKGSKSYEEVNKEFGQYLHKVIYMPIVNLDSKDAVNMIKGYVKNCRPLAFELVFKNDTSLTDAVRNQILQGGSKIWINSLWASLNGGHDDDLAVTDIPGTYGWLVAKRATLIQTDRPVLMIDYLKTRNLHN